MTMTMTKAEVEMLNEALNRMTKADMVGLAEGMKREVCMETLKKKDHDLKLTGNYKKCYNYIAEQFIDIYIDGKTRFTIMDDTESGRFYAAWEFLLHMLKCIVEYDERRNSRCGYNFEDVIDNSGISRKVWMNFFDYYFQDR